MSEIRYEAMDGYHGGKYGHMPPGCLRDILQMLRDCPSWRLSMDVEPVSWELLRRRDPAAYLYPGSACRATVSLQACAAFHASQVELDGRVSCELGEGTVFTVDMPAFAVRTLRLTKGGEEDACNH